MTRFTHDATEPLDTMITTVLTSYSVAFSGRSSITYTDQHNSGIRITAVYTPGLPVHAFTDPLPASLTALPPGLTRADYALLVEERITAAAVESGHLGVTFFRPRTFA